MDQFYNPYSYVGANPLGGVDPEGLDELGPTDQTCYENKNWFTDVNMDRVASSSLSGVNSSASAAHFSNLGGVTPSSLGSIKNTIKPNLSDAASVVFGAAATSFNELKQTDREEAQRLLRSGVRNLRRGNPKMRIRGQQMMNASAGLERDAARSSVAEIAANAVGGAVTIGFSANDYANYLKAGGSHPMRYKIYLSTKAGFDFAGGSLGAGLGGMSTFGAGTFLGGAAGYLIADKSAQFVYQGIYGNE
jgi:hypothetical protein